MDMARLDIRSLVSSRMQLLRPGSHVGIAQTAGSASLLPLIPQSFGQFRDACGKHTHYRPYFSISSRY